MIVFMNIFLTLGLAGPARRWRNQVYGPHLGVSSAASIRFETLSNLTAQPAGIVRRIAR